MFVKLNSYSIGVQRFRQLKTGLVAVLVTVSPIRTGGSLMLSATLTMILWGLIEP